MASEDGRSEIGGFADSRPAYWGRCDNMDFDGLRGYIADCLERHGAGGSECPNSPEEFRDLLSMLVGKADAPGPKNSKPRPAYRLNRLVEKRRRTAKFLEEHRGKPGSSRKSVRDAERNLENIKREMWERQDVLRYGNTEPDVSLAHYGAVERLRKKMDHAFGGGDMRMVQYQWEAVPSGPAPVDGVVRIYRERQLRKPIADYQEERLEKVRELHPKEGHMGRDRFYDYVIFTFDYTSKALMECPKYGNAIFVIESNLEPARWLQMNKQELIEHPDVTKIPHRKGWFEEVKTALGTKRSEGTAA